jgi:hypothetical protein
MCFVVIVKTETETLFYGGRCFNGVALFDIFLDKKNFIVKKYKHFCYSSIQIIYILCDSFDNIFR